MAGSFLHLIIGFEIGRVMFLVEGSVSLNFSIFRFLPALEKHLSKMFAFFSSSEIISSPSTNKIFSEDLFYQIITVSQFIRVVYYL